MNALINAKLEELCARLTEAGLTGHDIPDFDDWWDQQVGQYPRKGPPGLSYFRGEMGGPDDWYVDCLLWRDKKGKLLGVVNHYPVDMPPHELKGNINVMVDPAHQGEGIGKTLLKAAIKRWDVNLDQQNWTPKGDRLRQSVDPKPMKPKKDRAYRVWETRRGEETGTEVRASSGEEAEEIYRTSWVLPRSLKLSWTVASFWTGARAAKKPEPRIKLGGKMRTISTKPARTG